MRRGVAIPVPGLSLRTSLELAREAEQLGYDDVWSSEVSAADGLTPLAALAATTSRVRLGLALAPAFTRPPALLAMSAASLQEISGGRFALGVGCSSQVIVERWMGGEFSRPLTRVRETVEAVRAILSGEKTAYAGDTLALRDFRLGLGAADVPLFVGALGPRMYELAGAIGDGVLVTFAAAERLPTLLEGFRAGARAAGREPAALEVWCRVLVAIGDSPRLRDSLRRFVAGYGVVPGYNALLTRQGFGAQAAAMRSAWADGRRAEAAAAVDDALLDALFAIGDERHCRRRLEAYREAGVTTLIVDAVTDATEPAQIAERVRATFAALAPHPP